MSWQPTASLAVLKQRANILAAIRQFFAERQVLEVDTPLLCHHGVTDPYLDNFTSTFNHQAEGEPTTLNWQTSPEYAMKRLLCSGSGSIYQLCKAFRNEQAGPLHNPEFTLLEWYRVGFDHHQLMDEVSELLCLLLDCPAPQRMTYQQAFIQHLAVDPLSTSMHGLRLCAESHQLNADNIAENERDFLLQWLFSSLIEPAIGQQQPVFIYNFPASQAALARIAPEDNRVAQRFEVYFKGIELANGYHELADSTEQQRRFEQDNLQRQKTARDTVTQDPWLLQALEHGLPNCAGVAMGIDRLVMLATGQQHIQGVQTFPIDRA